MAPRWARVAAAALVTVTACGRVSAGGVTLAARAKDTVTIESPAAGAVVRSPLRVQGTASVFEAMFRLRLVDAKGQVLADQMVTASCGTGCEGRFVATLSFGSATGSLRLIADEVSAATGERIVLATVPLVAANIPATR
jgi:hypothetical protein